MVEVYTFEGYPVSFDPQRVIGLWEIRSGGTSIRVDGELELIRTRESYADLRRKIDAAHPAIEAIQQIAYYHHDDYHACRVCKRALDTFVPNHQWSEE